MRSDYHPLSWYKAYNAVKHDRAENLPQATFEHLTDAWCGLAVVLTARFLFEDFSAGRDSIELEGLGGIFEPGFEAGIGSFLGIKLPVDVPESERYEFSWSEIREQENPFAKYDFDGRLTAGNAD